jgi:hypothetical protein
MTKTIHAPTPLTFRIRMVKPTRPTITTIIRITCVIQNAFCANGAVSKGRWLGEEKNCQTKSRMRQNDSTTTIFRSPIALRFNGTCAGRGGDADGSGSSDTAESKPEAGLSADLGEDSGGDGGSWMGLAGTLTGRLQ